MKKILHLTHTDIRNDSRIIKSMIGAQAHGYLVEGIGVLSAKEPNLQGDADDLSIISIKIKSKKLTFLPDALRHFFTLIELFFKMIYIGVKTPPHLIHCNDTLVLPIGIIMKLFTRAKLVYAAHELESDRNSLSKTLGKLTLFLERLCWPFVDGLIVVSPSIMTWYTETISPKPGAVVMNSPHFEATTGERKEKSQYLRKVFSIPKNEKIFIYVGILGVGRGIEVYIDAFKKKRDAHLVFLGFGEFEEKLINLSKQFKNIHFHKSVKHDKVVDLVQSADVGLCLVENVSLSDYYCLPNKLFEYSFSGLHVIASDFPDMSEIVNKYELGITIQPNASALEVAIEQIKVKSNFEDCDTVRLNDLSWNKQLEKLLDLYDCVGV